MDDVRLWIAKAEAGGTPWQMSVARRLGRLEARVAFVAGVGAGIGAIIGAVAAILATR